MTNYEKIKSMSVDELADFLTVEPLGFAACKLYQSTTGNTYTSKTVAIQDTKRWLESEVEE